MPSYQGKCDCGDLEWTANLDEEVKHILCHCKVCQNLSGGAYTLNAIVPKSSLTFTKNGDKLKVYTYKGDSGNPVQCYYCPNCTTHPYHFQAAQGDDKIILRTGLLQDANGFPIAAEIYGKQRYKFQPEIAETFSVLPPS